MINNAYDGSGQNRVHLQNNGFGQNSGGSQNDNYPLHLAENKGSAENSKGKKDRYLWYYDIGKVLIVALTIVKLVFQAIKIFPKCYGFSSPGAAVFCLLLFAVIPLGLTLSGWRLFVLGEQIVKSKKKNCSVTVDALLYDYREVVHTDDEGGKSYTYYAMYEFAYNGVKHTVISKEAYYVTRYKKIRCKLLIDPDDPLEIYEIENEFNRVKWSRKTGIILLIVGFLIMRLFTF